MTTISQNVIQPASGQALTIKDEGGTASITIQTDGDLTLAENAYLGSGKGIYFDGQTTSANFLDDYEEGTWTPVVTRTSSNPTGTPSTDAVYTKIGDTVTVVGYIILNGFSGGSGQWRCTLPFTNISITTGLSKARVYMDGDSADRQFRVTGNANTLTLNTPSNDGAYQSNITYMIWYFSGTYKVA
jgi:hypothetical protein